MRTLVMSVLILGCTHNNGGGDSNISIDDLGPKLASVACTKIFQCCTQSEIATQFMDFTVMNQPITTEPECESFYDGLYAGLAVPDYKASIAVGRISYDGDAAATCLDGIAAESCSDYSMDVATSSEMVCSDFIMPLVATGGGCTQDYECTTNNCVGATVTPGGQNTDGACMALPGVGQACSVNCQTGLYCGFDGTSASDTCLSLKADGASCQSSSECAGRQCPGSGSGDAGTCATGATCDGA
jgi:hypothetical protein